MSDGPKRLARREARVLVVAAFVSGNGVHVTTVAAVTEAVDFCLAQALMVIEKG